MIVVCDIIARNRLALLISLIVAPLPEKNDRAQGNYGRHQKRCGRRAITRLGEPYESRSRFVVLTPTAILPIGLIPIAVLGTASICC